MTTPMPPRGFPMEKTAVKWILLAHRAGARIYSSRATENEPLSLVKEIPFPAGRRQNREIDADDKGSRYTSTAGRTNVQGGHAPAPSHQQKHGVDPHTEAVDRVAEDFAHELSRVLKDGRTHGEYDQLVLVAEPAFLGKIRGNLDKETSNRVVTTLKRNWVDLPQKDLFSRLADEVPGLLH